MVQHVTITMDIDPDNTMDKALLKLCIYPHLNAPVSEEDIHRMLTTSETYKKYCDHPPTYGIIVSGSRSVSDTLLVDTLLHKLCFETYHGIQPTLLLNTTPGPGFMATGFANLHKLDVQRVTPDWDNIGKLAGGVCALDMIDELKKYTEKAVLLIWDEQSGEVPYFFEPALYANMPLYVYSTARNKWLSADELQPSILAYADKVARCRYERSVPENK